MEKHIPQAPGFAYEDGFHVYFFNTTGHLGGSQPIRNMLSYIRNSRVENVTDEATTQLNEYIGSIKASEVVREKYMTWDEIIQKEIEEATKEKDAAIAERDAQISQKDAQISQKDARIRELEALLTASKN